MLSVEQVLHVIARVVLPLAPVGVDIRSQWGGVMAQDLRLDEDSPRFDRSQLDGFAVRGADTHTGAMLLLAGQVDAGGRPYTDSLAPGTCVGINTGAVVPPGADAILMVEHATREMRNGVAHILVHQAVKPGHGIQKRGSDAKAADIILHAGVRLGPAQAALCAAAGVARPLVRRARVAVLSTGDELVPIQTPAPLPDGKIRNSNQVMLCALAQEAGTAVLDLGAVSDEPPVMQKVLERGLREADLLVVCGGMSMGTRDFVPGLLNQMGVEMHVEKARIKPGKPFILGTRGHGAERTYVAGLPGNPVSSFVTFQRFVRAMIRRMEAATEGPRILRAQLDRSMAENGDREFYQPCILESGASGLIARLLTWKGSADMFTLGKAGGLVIQAMAAPAVEAGGMVDVLTW